MATADLGPTEQAPRPFRLFVAVDLPAEALDAIVAAIEPWRRRIEGARWGDPAGWHITLKFLGATQPERVVEVADRIAVAAAEVAPFSTRLDGLGTFPLSGPARVLWAGLDDRPGRLAGLAHAIDAALVPRYELERRPLHPHVTVARLDPPRRVAEAFTETAVEPVTIGVDQVCLYRSHLGGGTPRYEMIATAPLGSG